MTTHGPDNGQHPPVANQSPLPDADLPPASPQGPTHDHETGHGGHRWMMIACCIPMLIVVGVLIASGAAGGGAIIFAVVCLGMMWLMMRAMPGGH